MSNPASSSIVSAIKQILERQSETDKKLQSIEEKLDDLLECINADDCLEGEEDEDASDDHMEDDAYVSLDEDVPRVSRVSAVPILDPPDVVSSSVVPATERKVADFHDELTEALPARARSASTLQTGNDGLRMTRVSQMEYNRSSHFPSQARERPARPFGGSQW